MHKGMDRTREYRHRCKNVYMYSYTCKKGVIYTKRHRHAYIQHTQVQIHAQRNIVTPRNTPVFTYRKEFGYARGHRHTCIHLHMHVHRCTKVLGHTRRCTHLQIYVHQGHKHILILANRYIGIHAQMHKGIGQHQETQTNSHTYTKG